MNKKIVIIGAGVAGVNAATKLVDNGYPGELITIIDAGKDPHNRQPNEVMQGFLGAGGFSDGKLTYHTDIGGHMSKYCGEEKAYELFDQVLKNFKRFHPKPDEIQYSAPQAEPDFIKPYFDLRLHPVYHVGTDYLAEIGKNWYDYLVEKGINFAWEKKVDWINFNNSTLFYESLDKVNGLMVEYDKLIFAVGKSGIDFTQQLIEKYNLPTETKPVQIGVRFEAPQKYFQKLIDISYDFKLYRKFDSGLSIRSFCTNNNAAYVAVEETYGDFSYNGHAKKDEKYRNNMTNFGILMEIPGIENPFEWSRNLVKACNKEGSGLYYSPSRKPSQTSEGETINTIQIDPLELLKIIDAFGETYFEYIVDFINNLQKIFPDLKNDWGIYIPEVKYLSPEPLVSYNNLALTEYPNVYFTGDTLSARGITVSGAQGIYAAENILNLTK